MSTNNNGVDERGGWTHASNAQADSLCPGRHLMQAGVPEKADDQGGEYAESGNRLHHALLKRDPSALTLEEKERYDVACALEAKLVADYFGHEASKVKTFREQRFWCQIRDPVNNRVLKHSGQPDVVHRVDTRALVIEYKGLYGDIPPSPENLQLRDQAVLVKGHFVFIDEVLVDVIQPALSHTLNPCLYDKEALAQAEQQMFARVAASNTPNAPRFAGSVQCKYCRAKMLCPEYQRMAGSLVPGMLTLLEVTPANWSPQQRAYFLSQRKVAQDWLDNCTQAIKDILAKDPEAVEGWFLVPGVKRESVQDPQKCFERFASLGGNAEQFMACVAVTKAKLKDAVSKLTGARGKALETAMATLTDGLVSVSQAAPTLKEGKQ